jgi:hypothetical protein
VATNSTKSKADKVIAVPEAKKPFARIEVSAAQEKKILALLKGGKNRREVSQAVGLSQMQIDKVRKAHGLHTPRVKKPSPKAPKSQNAPKSERKTP